MRSRNMRQIIFCLTALLAAVVLAQTPVIGGICKLGTADVQIGGKQTQFFLKCEPTSDSQNGEGVWVVKSRIATPAPTAPVENTQQNMAPPRKNANPNICEQDNGARENEGCSVSATCLQANNGYPTTYLQCDQTTMRWMRKSCQETFIFNFEQQTCVVPKRVSHVNRQQTSSGLVCTFSSCSNNNPCSSGTCNNGYCCSTGGAPAPIMVQANPGCNGCQQQAAPMIAVASCPGGAYSVGNCNSGFCSPGYQCIQNSCCPQYAPQPSIRVYSCPSGGNAVGACIAGSCSTGYSCVQGNCCPARETKNPFVCPDGTQAVGGCVNGQCGAGYRCSNGLCCAGTSTTVKCLDGSEAVGACIPSCQGDACGRTTVSYYCGSGYTCTTGNICCAVNSCPDGGDVLGPTVNGLCPTGYVAQGSICCSAALCPDGSASTPAINGLCPTTLTLTNGVCCAGAVAPLTCSADISVGPCNPDGSCQVGYRCDSAGETCCPVVNIVDPQYQLGPSVAGLCPAGYAVVYLPPLAADGEGVCIDLQSIPGVCAVDAQSGPCSNGQCPTGFSCFVEADVCCPPTAVFRKLRPGAKATKVGSRPTYGRPLHSYMPQMMMNDSPVMDSEVEKAVEKNLVAPLPTA